MKIAIVGAGLAGLATAYYLKPLGEITLFSDGPGASSLPASCIAAGLLHKFVGMHAKKNLFGDEALDLALQLIGPYKKKTGLLRIASNDNQVAWFQKAAQTYPAEIEPVDARTLWIKEGWVVDCPAYLATLSTTHRIIHTTIHTLDELEGYDLIVLCMGASTRFYPITPIRGQLLEVTGAPYPAVPISGQIYVIPQEDRMIVGATYEREPIDAQAYLLPRLKALLPDFKLDRILATKAAFRASTPDHLPFVRQINAKTWAFAGLGSKGLLYHAYYAHLLYKLIARV